MSRPFTALHPGEPSSLSILMIKIPVPDQSLSTVRVSRLPFKEKDATAANQAMRALEHL